MLVALAMAFTLRYHADGTSPSISEYLPRLSMALILWAALSACMRLDGFRGGWNLPAVASQLMIAVPLLITLIAAASYLMRDYFSRYVLLIFGALLLLGFIAPWRADVPNGAAEHEGTTTAIPAAA